MKFNTYLSFSVACVVLTMQENNQVDALSVEMLDNLTDCAPPQIFFFPEEQMDLAQKAHSDDTDSKTKAKRLAAAKATLQAAKDARAQAGPNYKKALTYEQRVLNFIDEQDAKAHIEEMGAKDWEFMDLFSAFSVIGGFLDGFALSNNFGAGRAIALDTNDMVAKTLENQKTGDAKTMKMASEQEQKLDYMEHELHHIEQEHDHIQPLPYTMEASLAQTLTSAELGADA